MNLKSVMIAVTALAAPAAGASAQGYYGYDAPPPPPPYAYAYDDTGASAPAHSCADDDFTIVGAHAGVTVLGFGLNSGARFTAPTGCRRHHRHNEGPRFAPRPYAPPTSPAYGPPPYAQQGWGQEAYPTPPCGCGPEGW